MYKRRQIGYGFLLSIVLLTACNFTKDSVLEVTSKNFESVVLQSDLPVIVDFYAVWCGPCNKMKPIFEEVAKKFEHKIVFVKINVDEQPALVQHWGITSYPSFLFFNKGKILGKMEGGRSLEVFVQLCQNFLNSVEIL